MTKPTRIVVIMAGGRGTRLWPLSRHTKPKQFHALVSERTMLHETYDRLAVLTDASNIYVATNAAYVDAVRADLPMLDPTHIIAEPTSRDTASGIALVCAVIAARHPGAIVATFPADHVITNPGLLHSAVDAAVRYLTEGHENAIVTFGIRPRYPETGYGYIKRGAPQVTYGEHTIFAVERFVEKPDLVRAKTYLEEGSYEWNAGMFIFCVEAMVAKFATLLPMTHEALQIIARAVDTPKYTETLAAVFPHMEKVSVDYAILEKDACVVVLPLALAWSDVGSWAALRDMVATHTRENVSRGTLVTRNSEGLFVRSTKPVVAIGVEDLIIVETEDAILVCDRDHAQDVSAVVKEMGESPHAHLL